MADDLTSLRAAASRGRIAERATARASGPDLTKARVAATQARLSGAAPAEEQEFGLLKEARNLFDMAQALPGGMLGLAQDARESALNASRIPATAAVKMIGQAKGMSDEEIAGQVRNTWGMEGFVNPEMIEGVQADAPAQEGLGKWLQDHGSPIDPGEFSAVAHELFPAAGAMGASAQKTGGRAVDLAAAGNPVGMLQDISQGKNPLQDLGDTQYAEAWNRGELAPVAIEDIANLSMVASGAGAGAGRLAGRAGARATALETELSAANALGGASDAGIAAKAARARSAEAALGGAEQGLNKVAHLTGRAGDLPATMWKVPGILGETGGGRFGLFRKGAAAGNLGERLVPFGAEGTRTGLVGMMRERGLTSLVDNLTRSETGERLVTWAEDHPLEAIRRQQMKMEIHADLQAHDNLTADARQGLARGGIGAMRSAKRAGRELGLDPEVVGAAATLATSKTTESLAALLDDPAAIAVAADELAAAGVIVAADPVMARDQIIAAAVGSENVEAFKVASQYQRGTMAPEAVPWFERTSDIMNRTMREPRELRYAIMEGSKAEVTPEGIAKRKEQFGNEPMPSVVNEAVAPWEQRVEKQRQRVERLQKLADTAEGRRLDPAFSRPASEIARDVAPSVDLGALAPIERSAQQQGIEGYAQDQARGLFERDLVEPASAAEVAQGVRRDVRAQDRAGVQARRLREAQDVEAQTLDEIGAKALPDEANLFEQGAAAKVERTAPPRERARAEVENIVGPKKGPRTGPTSNARRRVAEVREKAAERVRLARRDVEVESRALFASDVPPELPFIPPRLAAPRRNAKGQLSRNWLKDTPDFWEGVADPKWWAEHMAPEPWDMHKTRMAIELAEYRRTGVDFFEDGADLRKEYDDLVKAGNPPDLQTEIGARTSYEKQGYQYNQAYADIAERHAEGTGVENVTPDAGATAIVDSSAWVSDYERLAQEHRWLTEAEADLTGAQVRGRRARNDAADRLYQAGHMADLTEMTEVAPGVEVPLITEAEIAAALDQGYVPMKTRGGKTVHRPYNQAERDGLMAKAIEERRAELESTLADTYQRQVDEAFATDWVQEGIKPPWEMTRAEYLAEYADQAEILDLIPPGADAELAARSLDRLTPFDGSLDDVHQQWLHRAEERGLATAAEAPTVVTPDQLADRAIGDTLSRVTDAFEADGGAKGAGYQGLTKKERHVYRRMEAAARAADAASVVADTRAAVSDLQARHRQGIVDDTLDRQALRFGNDAERAGRRAGDVYKARLRSVENVVRQVVKDQRKIGVKEGEFQIRQKDLNRGLRDLTRAEKARDQAYVRAQMSPEATPARFGEGIRARSKVTAAFTEAADRLDQQAPGAGDVLRTLIDDIDLDALDAYTLSDVMGNPTQIISGATGDHLGGGTARNSELGFIGETGEMKRKRRRSGQSEYGIKAQTALEARRLTDQMRNIGTRTIAEKWGRTAAEVTAELDRTRRGGPDLRNRTGADLAKAADEAGYTAWDPSNYNSTVPAANYGPDTILIPKVVKEATTKAFNESGSFLKGIEKWYDRRFMGQIKMFWLALSPRWLTANVVGNAVMGMVGGGIAPWDYAHHLGNARALLAEDAPLEWETGNRMQRRAFARRQRLVERGDSLRLQGYDMPAQALNRGFTHEELPFLMGDDLTGPKSPVRKLAAKSYAANEYVDNLNRAAVYLAKAEPRRVLHEKWHAGEIGDVQFFEELAKTRTGEQALNQALRAAGDFSKMTSFEKSVVKRIIPFYPWYRHITKLAMSMPIYAPARTVWLLHLADVFGGDPDEERGAGQGTKLQDSLPGFAKGSIPLGGDRLLATAGMNPFESGLESPFYSPEGILGATTPALQWPAALVLGRDMKHGLRDFTRPPGDGNLDEYGRPTNTPLKDSWGEAGRYMAQQLPQGRLVLTGVEKPVLRYDTGDPMIVGGNEIESGRPSGLAGVGLGALGVPTPVSVDAQDIANRTAKRRRDQAKKRARYESQRERLDAG